MYTRQDAVFAGQLIYLGLELETGYFHVEGSSALWDRLFAFRGLDERDLENAYLVAEYVHCLKQYGRLP